MHILVTILGLIVILALIIYKVNGKFEIKEALILLAIILVGSLGTYYFIDYQKSVVPEIFKKSYEKQTNTKILKLSSKRLDNKQLSSKTKFEYDFEYIISKDSQEFVCSLKNVKIKKIEDEFIFDNLDIKKEICKER